MGTKKEKIYLPFGNKIGEDMEAIERKKEKIWEQNRKKRWEQNRYLQYKS